MFGKRVRQICGIWLVLGCLTVCYRNSAAWATDAFMIRVVDQDTGRGVPLVELRTVHDVRYYTDSAGVVAFKEPGLMDRRVFFHVSSHGYEYPPDGFGYHGKALQITPGGSAELRIKRLNIAERLYRVTGAGIYRDSFRLGLPVPIEQPLLNSEVLGLDSVLNAVYRDRIYWFWGDTSRPSYPLGNFHVTGATSSLPSGGGLSPAEGIDFSFIQRQDGFSKSVAKLPGEGPTWLTALITLPIADRERMLAAYVKIEPPLKVIRRGLAEFDDKTRQFRPLVEFDLDWRAFPNGHAFRRMENGKEYVYVGNPFPVVRVPATLEKLCNPDDYEVYTCLTAQSLEGELQIERDGSSPVYAWKRGAMPFTPKLQKQLIEGGQLGPGDALYQLHDPQGQPVMIHSGSVAWNDYRERWIMIAVQESGSTSYLGEVWYAEAENLTGPWRNARKIVSHNKYSFYNPKHHKIFDQEGGRFIFFEGTYSNTFSRTEVPTPRYNYNQIMYRLDLAHPQLQ